MLIYVVMQMIQQPTMLVVAILKVSSKQYSTVPFILQNGSKATVQG